MNTNFNFNNRSTNVENMSPQAAARTRSLLTYTFGWMALAMILSIVGALLFAYNPALAEMLHKIDPVTLRAKPTILYWILLFAPFAFILVMSFGFNRLSFPVLLGLFLAYAACTGVTLSVVIPAYGENTVLKAFGSAAGLFGLMAVVGATTKTDLTSFGRIMTIGLFGIVIASLINMFTRSSGFDYLISIVGVAVFTGLVAFNVQRIKNISAESDGSEGYMKLSVMSAFTLYLDFINIFLFLLRIFGRRD
ncbi:MAG: Bax inhibitor-1/YccA family protein [Bacteroidia bacterium]